MIMDKNSKPNQTIKIQINKDYLKLIKKSILLNKVGVSNIINKSLELFFQNLKNEKHPIYTEIQRSFDLTLFYIKMDNVQKYKRYINSKIHFKNRFIKDLRKGLNNTTSKSDILDLLSIWIEISLLYDDFIYMTEFLIKIKEEIKNTNKRFNLLREYLDIQITSIEEKKKDLYNFNEKVNL